VEALLLNQRHRAKQRSSRLWLHGSKDGNDSEASYDSAEDEDARKIRDQMRQYKRREREMRMSNMGQEQRAKQLARQQNRDISEKVALGLVKSTQSKELMLDSRLFNQESSSGRFADDDAYNLYDRSLFHGSTTSNLYFYIDVRFTY
jgi:SNW domain-containing protein 1